LTVVKLADYPSHNYVASELQLHIPEGGISALSNELLASFEKSNEEANKLECNDKVKPPQCELAESEGVATVVAQHYNQLSEKGVDDRKESRIFHMRNLNNWIKSRIIGNLFLFSAFLKLINSKCHVLGNALDRIREEKGHNYRINVLDLGCGKGGDLLKWERGRVAHVVCADIAETSIEQSAASLPFITLSSLYLKLNKCWPTFRIIWSRVVILLELPQMHMTLCKK